MRKRRRADRDPLLARKITEVIITFQRPARPRERKDVVGFREAHVQMKILKRVEIPVEIPVGEGLHGTNALRHIIARGVMKHRPKGAQYYYVTVKEERERLDRESGEIEPVSIFRTVMPRTELPQVSIRHVRH